MIRDKDEFPAGLIIAISFALTVRGTEGTQFNGRSTNPRDMIQALLRESGFRKD